MDTNIREGPPPAYPDISLAGPQPAPPPPKNEWFGILYGLGMILSWYPIFCIFWNPSALVATGAKPPSNVAEVICLAVFATMASFAWPLTWLMVGVIYLSTVPI